MAGDSLGADTRVASIRVIDIIRLDEHLEAVIPPSKKKAKAAQAAQKAAQAAAGENQAESAEGDPKVKSAPSTGRKYLYALSSLVETAIEYGLIVSNPVTKMKNKPSSETETETVQNERGDLWLRLHSISALGVNRSKCVDREPWLRFVSDRTTVSPGHVAIGRGRAVRDQLHPGVQRSEPHCSNLASFAR